ncbi:hypothetical protein CEW92_06620 [Bacillaceae bacterium SAS-127]|nr:hypothetical protein CEW92_06620 [Bacillaceae bacterium SAS-127]
MRYKFIMTMVLFVTLFPFRSHAEQATERVLLTYSSDETDVPGSVWMLDSLLSHFDVATQVVKDTAVTQDMLQEADWLVYYGLDQTPLPSILTERSSRFSGKLALIGKNAEQFPLYEGGPLKQMNQVPSFKQQRTGKEIVLSNVLNVYSPSKLHTDDQVLLTGTIDDKSFPLIYQNGKVFYAGAKSLTDGFQYFLADALHEFFRSNHEEKHTSYIRLEDITPSSDAEALRKVGQYFIDRQIPFLMAVTPVSINPDTSEKLYLADQQPLLEVLQYLQSNGGSVIAHGYAQPSNDIETNGLSIKKPEAFSNEEDYQQYLSSLLEKEQISMEETMRTTIDSLSSLGLFPVSFEATDDTLTHTAYRSIPQYFSTIFGQMSFSPLVGKNTGTLPYVAQPSFLHGMTVYPETIGYIDTTSYMPIEDMKKQLEPLLLVRDSTISTLYHSYIGVDYLPDVIELIESVSHTEWLDMQTIVKSSIKYETESNDVKDNLQKIMPETFIEKALFLLSIVVFFFVTLFTLYTLYLRSQRKKQLFKER